MLGNSQPRPPPVILAADWCKNKQVKLLSVRLTIKTRVTNMSELASRSGKNTRGRTALGMLSRTNSLKFLLDEFANKPAYLIGSGIVERV